MKNFLLKALVFVLICYSFLRVHATTYYVNDNSTSNDVYSSAVGNNGNPGTAASPFLTLSYALTQSYTDAIYGDTIYIDAGTFNAYTHTINHAVTIIGAGTGNTIFDINAAVYRFGTISSSDVTIKNITFREYYLDADGQVILINGGATNVVLENIVVKDCPGSTSGGANIYITASSSVTINRCLFSCSGWNADQGGAVLVNSSTLTVNNSIFKDNHNFTGFGGAIEITGTTPTVSISECNFDHNSAYQGGAIYQASGTLTVTGSCFHENYSEGDASSTTYGGGAFSSQAVAGSSCSFTNCTFTDNQHNPTFAQFNANTAGDGSCFLFRGANGTFSFDKCTFDNVHPSPGRYDKGQDFFLDEGASGLTGSITNCTFAAAPDANGGDQVNIYNLDLEAADVNINNSNTWTFTGTAFTNTDALAPVWDPGFSGPNTNCSDATNIVACGASVVCATELNPPVIVACVPDKTLSGTCSAILPDYRSEVSAFDDCYFTIAQSPLPGTSVSGVITVTMTVTDQAGNYTTCTFEVTAGASAPSAPVVGTVTDPTCTVATGSVDLSGLPSSGTWTVTASPGGAITTGTGTTTTFSGLAAGTYTFTVTNSLGCTSPASASSATINTQPTTPSAPVVGTVTDPTCTVATGSVDLSGLPASGTWTITATPGGATTTGTGTTATFSGLAAGTYTFTATNSVGCTSAASASIATINTQPTTPSAPLVGTVTDPTCTVATGSVDLSGLPASGTWTITATPGGTTTTGTGTTATFSGLAAGTYTFTVTNSVGCTSAASASSATINTQPTTPSAPVVGTVTDPTCTVATGSVDLSGLPASGIWTITATPGGTTTTGTGTTATFSGLAAGTYTFTVTNSDGCTSALSALSATINTQPGLPTAPITGTITQPTCTVNTGSVDLSGLPSSGSWTVTVSPGGSTITSSGTTATFSGLVAGTYTFSVTNNLGCLSIGSSPAITINAQPATPTAPVLGNITDPTCTVATGSVDLSGLPSSGNWTVTASPGGDTIQGSGTTITFDSLVPGTYTFTVTNSVGCTSTASASSATINTQPVTPIAPIVGTVTDPTCTLATGSVDLSGLPAAGSWTVTESPGGTTFTGTGTTGTFSGLAPGTYSFTVTNSDGCSSSTSSSNATINNAPANPNSPLLDSLLQPTCTIATGEVYISGLPSSGNWTITATPGGTTTTGTGTTATFSGLAAGTYTFTVTNDQGCTSGPSVTIATINSQPVIPSSPITGTITQPTCTVTTGSVNLSGLPASGSYTVTASPGGATYSGTGTTATFPGLAPGTYTFTVTNSDGCTSGASSTSATIDAQPVTPSAPIVGIVTDPTCTLATGSADLSGLPSSGSWTVTASPGGTTYTGTGSSTLFSGLPSGTYTFTVTNDDGCTSTASTSSATISTQPPTPTADITGTPSICEGEQISLTATGGVSYSWNTGDTTSVVLDSPSVTTTYTVTVMNAEGCSASDDITVTVNATPMVTLSSNPSDFAFVGQLITFTASPSGFDQYSFYIDSTLVQNTSNNMYLTSTLTNGQTVYVTVDDNGCTSAVSTLDLLIKPLSNAFTPNNDGKNDLFAKGLDLTIINRWDQILYQGFDGWDGKYDGKRVSPGTYFYIIKLTDPDNITTTLNGAVMLIGE